MRAQIIVVVLLAICFVGCGGEENVDIGENKYALTAEYNKPFNWYFPQETLWYCGPSVAQTWIYTIYTYRTQDQLACVDPWMWLTGTNAQEMVDMMNIGTNYNFGFYYSNLYNQSQAEWFLINKFSNNKRVAIAANTVYSDGSRRIGGHWLGVHSIKVVNDQIVWVKVHDPLYNSSWQSNYKVLS